MAEERQPLDLEGDEMLAPLREPAVEDTTWELFMALPLRKPEWVSIDVPPGSSLLEILVARGPCRVYEGRRKV